jgi:hypothetical protein
MKTATSLCFALALLATSAVPTMAAEPEGEWTGSQRTDAAPYEQEGLLLRAGGNVTVADHEQVGALVVLGGAADVRGRVGALLVVGGDARLDGAEVGDLTVVGGRARLRGGTTVTGELHLVGSELERSDDVRILGPVTHESAPRWGKFPFGLLFALGASLAVVLAGIVAAALAPGALEHTSETLRRDPGRTVLAAMIVWFVGPPLAILSFLTIVGIPLGLGVLFVLPGLAFVGYLVAGNVVGDRLLRAMRREGTRHRPYLAVSMGLVVLMLLGAVPVLGALVGLVSAGLGGGAIALTLWRAFRARGGHPATTSRAETPLAGSVVAQEPAHP